jgi:2-dehydro-3-deoxygluconokinase
MSELADPTVLAPRAFDVICAGEALLNVEPAQPRLGFRAGGGALNAALGVAAKGLRVGLATVLPEDAASCAILDSLVATGVDIKGVAFARPSNNFILVRGGARQVVSFAESDQPVAIPTGWSSQVLLLSGMSPIVSHSAALCKAARAARRAGTTIVVDVNAQWSEWQGRDARSIRMVLREADVVWCNAQDLFGLNMDLPSLRAALRPTAVLVLSNGAGTASATGPFGEVAHTLPKDKIAPFGEGDAFTTAICYELARTHNSDAALWSRTLQRAHASLA